MRMEKKYKKYHVYNMALIFLFYYLTAFWDYSYYYEKYTQ